MFKIVRFHIHPFWFLGDTMLRANIGPMKTCVTKKTNFTFKNDKLEKWPS